MKTTKILLLEYDPIINADMQMRLKTWGYTVSATTDANEALALSQHTAFDLAIINFKQPFTCQGKDLTEVLGLKTLVLTGLRDVDVKRLKDFPPFFPILFKPFTQPQLKKAVFYSLAF